jgi:chromate transporter
LISQEKLHHLNKLAILFFKLGSIGFGGLAVLISMMEYEVVSKQKWLTREKFLDFVGASNLIPGPTAVEVALQIGLFQAGWLGFVVSGICFVLPSTLITIGLAWIYIKFGSLPQIAPFLDGIKPVIPAVILVAVWKLGKTAVKNTRLAVVGLVVLICSILGMNEVMAILLGGLIGMFWNHFDQRLKPQNEQQQINQTIANFWIPKAVVILVITLATVWLIDIFVTGNPSIWKISLFFLKVGTLLYGGGYVLIAFLQGGLVNQLSWLTSQQLFDAIAIGQITPGPLLSTVTFIGYLLLGTPGAIVATVSLVLPSFFFSATLNSVIPQLRRLRWTSAFLDAVNVSSIALMASVTVKLSQSALNNWQSWLIAICACIIAFRWKVNASFLIFLGALVGWILFSF